VVTWQFSCSLAPESCRFRLSSKDGSISATLGKQTDLFNRGPSALPLRIISDEELTPFLSASEIEELATTSNLLQTQFASPQDCQIQRLANITDATITDAFFCLRHTIANMWRRAYETPAVCHCLFEYKR